MRKLFGVILCIFTSQYLISLAHSKKSISSSVGVMENTFQLIDSIPDNKGFYTTGTCFILTHHYQGNDIPILVTATHVLRKMRGDQIFINMRKKNTDETYTEIPTTITIREPNKNLWTEHKDVDACILPVSLPTALLPNVRIMSSILADDGHWENFEIFPGSKVLVFGYPDGQTGLYNFPILRSGIILTYPILPAKTIKQFQIESKITQGNSGGPIFFTNDIIQIDTNSVAKKPANSILGLISMERSMKETVSSTTQQESKYSKKTTNETEEKSYPMDIGIGIHAVFIRELIETLYP